MSISATSNMVSAEDEWREFEKHADCTPFQTFDWLSAWHHRVGMRTGVMPVIVTGRREGGDLLFLLPLAIERNGPIRRLVFLGRRLCDYNAPLLDREFCNQCQPPKFVELWNSIRRLLHKTYEYRHDLVVLDKMPAFIGPKPNPMASLATVLHPSCAYATVLGKDWGGFYASKRSSSTRRRDRTKRKRLTEFGELRFVEPKAPEAIRNTLSALFAQKSRWFARVGVSNLFARPGHADFFQFVASRYPQLVRVSRLDVGSSIGAASLGLIFRGCYYHLLASYDDGEVSRFGPGTAHLHELMQYAIAQGCNRFDFTIGDESYKRDWADSTVLLYDHVSGRGWLGLLAAALTIIGLRGKRRIKNSRMLWGVVTWIRPRLVRLKLRRPTHVLS